MTLQLRVHRLLIGPLNCRKNYADVVDYLLRNADFRFFSLCHIDDVDTVDENIFQAAPEVRCCRQVGQVLLYDTPNV